MNSLRKVTGSLAADGEGSSSRNWSQNWLQNWSQNWLQNWQKRAVRCAIALTCPFFLYGLSPIFSSRVQAQSGGAIQMKASRVEANSNTGIVTATGNVRIDYPSREIYATSAQAQYYSREQRIVLSGNVDILQEGNSLQAETVTYLIEEGRFVATPGATDQVEAVYILPESPNPEPSAVTQEPAPVPIPAVPDELPTDLGPIDSPNSF